MNNAHNLNLFVRSQPVELIQESLLDVLRGLLCSAETVEAADDEPAERTIIVARLDDGPWLTIFDDGPPQESYGMALAISERIGSPIVHLLVHDGDILQLGLHRAGDCIDQLSWDIFDEAREFPVSGDIGQWQRLLPQGSPPSAAADALVETPENIMPLNRLAELLELRAQQFHEIEDIDEEDVKSCVRLRLISASERKRHRAFIGKSKNAIRERTPLSPEPPPGDKAIPDLFIGKPAEVKRRLKPIVKKAIETMDWSVALTGIEHVPIDSISVSIMSKPPNAYESDDPLANHRVMLYLLADLLSESGLSAGQQQKLVLQGMERPWFCLAVISCGISVPPHGRSTALAALKKVLRWWPDLCRWGPMLNDVLHNVGMRRVYDWETWQIPVLRWCEELGHGEHEIKPLGELSGKEAFDQILTWVVESKP